MKYRGLKIFMVLFLVILVAISTAFIIRNKIYPYKYREYIKKYSKEYEIDPYIVVAVIKTESDFDANAKSSKNAVGLMQITEETGKWAAKEMELEDFKVEYLKDPEFNIRMGSWYLDNLKIEFEGNMDLVLAAYNGGRGNVQKWLKDKKYSKDGKTLDYIPFEETDKYIKKVKVNYNIYKFLYD